MRITILSANNRIPDWVERGSSEYLSRMPADIHINFVDKPLVKRGKSQSVARIRAQETQRLLDAVPSGDYLIALDEAGRSQSTAAVASAMQRWQMDGHNICILIGGPDGIDFSVCQPREKWSLSALTFPHPLVRVIVAEQLYRAWSVTVGHPYHRAS